MHDWQRMYTTEFNTFESVKRIYPIQCCSIKGINDIGVNQKKIPGSNTIVSKKRIFYTILLFFRSNCNKGLSLNIFLSSDYLNKNI